MPPQKPYEHMNVININTSSNCDVDTIEQDIEYIEPPFDSPLRRTAFFPATFNLIATIVSFLFFTYLYSHCIV